MKIIQVENYNQMSKEAASLLIDEISKNPSLAIGFCTGGTPLGLYKELIKSYKNKKVDFSMVKSFNLDEYYPIKKSNTNSFYYYMFHNLFNHINIKKTNIHIFNGDSKNPDRECLDYEKKIKRNSIDIQIIGVGVNGHIGFNEPGSFFASKTRKVKLSKQTLKINSKYFKNSKKIPTYALTVGIGTIIGAKKIILLASGKNKAAAIKCLYEREDPCFPVSFLRKHKDLTVIIDKKAGSLLK